MQSRTDNMEQKRVLIATTFYQQILRYYLTCCVSFLSYCYLFIYLFILTFNTIYRWKQKIVVLWKPKYNRPDIVRQSGNTKWEHSWNWSITSSACSPVEHVLGFYCCGFIAFQTNWFQTCLEQENQAHSGVRCFLHSEWLKHEFTEAAELNES